MSVHESLADLSQNARSRFFIGGEWVTAKSHKTRALISPMDEAPWIEAPFGECSRCGCDAANEHRPRRDFWSGRLHHAVRGDGRGDQHREFIGLWFEWNGVLLGPRTGIRRGHANQARARRRERLDMAPGVSFGGYKSSGMGREGGPEGLEAFLETQAVYMPGAP